jgi:hypothetical protein
LALRLEAGKFERTEIREMVTSVAFHRCPQGGRTPALWAAAAMDEARRIKGIANLIKVNALSEEGIEVLYQRPTEMNSYNNAVMRVYLGDTGEVVYDWEEGFVQDWSFVVRREAPIAALIQAFRALGVTVKMDAA